MAVPSSQRVVLITGISSGIGLSVATLLAGRQWTVIGTRRSGGEAIAGIDQRLMDVTVDASVDRTIAEILRDHGRIDAVINNAGAGHVATLEDDSIADIRQVFEVNFFGVVRVSKAVLPALRESSGRLLTVTSVGGIVGQPFNDAYCAAKFAVEGLMESLAPVARATGVKVSVIEPGFVKTAFVDNLHLDDAPVSGTFAPLRERYLARVRERMPLGQSAEDCAQAIVDVLENPDPEFRYQTSPNAAALVGVKLADPTGRKIQDLTSAWLAVESRP